MKYITTTARASVLAVTALLGSACGTEPNTELESGALVKRDRNGAQHRDGSAPTPTPPLPTADAGVTPTPAIADAGKPQPPTPVDPPKPIDQPPVVAPSTCLTDKIGGKIAHYLLNERSGTEAADTYGNSGYVTPVANWVPGNRGNALSFDGTTAITVPANERLNATGITGSVSVAAWVYTDGKSDGAIVNRNEEKTEFEHFGLGTQGGHPFLSVHFFRVVATSVIKANTWTLVSGSYDGVTARIFVNGKKEGEIDIGWPMATDRTPLIIGAEQGSDGALKNHFRGVIDDVSLYDRSLTEAEMRALAGDCNVPPPVVVPPPVIVPTKNSPFARYGFNEGNGALAKDLYGNNAEIMGPATWGKGFLSFNGQTMATVPNNSALQQTGLKGSVSISAWVRTSNVKVNGSTAIVNRAEEGTDYQHFGLSLDEGRPQMRVHFFSVTSPKTLPQNTWVHLAATYDGVTAKVYVDGVEMGMLDLGWPMATDTTALTIGGEINSGVASNLFVGDIDDVALFDRAVTADEVRRLMASRP